MVDVTEMRKNECVMGEHKRGHNPIWGTLYEEDMSKTQRLHILAEIMLAAITSKPSHFTAMIECPSPIYESDNVVCGWPSLQWFRGSKIPSSLQFHHPLRPWGPYVWLPDEDIGRKICPLVNHFGPEMTSMLIAHILLVRSSHMAPPRCRGLRNIVAEFVASSGNLTLWKVNMKLWCPDLVS